MKTLLLTSVFAFLGATMLHSQPDATITYDAPSKFNGLKTEDGQLYYTAYYGHPQPDTPYNIVIRLMNDQFETIRNDRIKGGYAVSIEDVEEHKGGLLFYLKSGSDGITVYYDKDGNKVWQKLEEKDKGRYNEVQMRSLGHDGIAVVHNHKADKKGFKLEVRDDQWNVTWSEGIYPEKGKFRYEQVDARNGKVSVLARYQGSFFSGESGYRLATFDVPNQQVLYAKSISDDRELCSPAAIKTFENGAALVAYYNVPTDEWPENLNFKKINADGGEAFHTQINNRDTSSALYELHPQPVERAFQRPEIPLVKFHKIESTENGIAIFGETYYHDDRGKDPVNISTEQQQLPPTDVFILDYVIMELTSDGKLDKIHRHKKPYKRIRAKGFLTGNSVAMAEYLEDYNFFGYRFGNPFTEEVITYGWYNNLKYAGFSNLSDDYESIAERILLDNTVVEVGKGSGSTTTYEFIKGEDFDEAEFRHYNNILPHPQEGKLVYYDFDRSTGEMAVHLVERKERLTDEFVEGKRKINGIPAGPFNGIKAFDDGGYYTWYLSEYGKGHTGYYKFLAFNESLETTGMEIMQLPLSARPAGVVSSGDHVQMAFQDEINGKWYFCNFSNEGAMNQTGELALKRNAKKVMTGSPRLMARSTGGLTMVQPYVDTATEENGMDVIHLSPRYNVEWFGEQYAPGGHDFSILAANANEDRVGVIHARASAGGQNQPERFVTVWDLAEGKQKYHKSLEEEGNFVYPEFLQFDTSNNLYITGLYFEGDAFNEKKATGYFLKSFDDEGKETVSKLMDWESIQNVLESGVETDFLISSKTKVLIQDMINMPDGGIKIIGEIFQKSAATTDIGLFVNPEGLGNRAFTVLDFVVFEYSPDGKLTNLYKMNKPEQSIVLPEHLEHQRGLSLSYMLRDQQVFSYRKIVGDQDPQLVYMVKQEAEPWKVYQQAISKASEPVVANAVVDIPRPEEEGEDDAFERLQAFQDKLDQKAEEAGKDFERILGGTSRRFHYSQNRANGIAINRPGQVLLYQYDPESYSVYMVVETLR